MYADIQLINDRLIVVWKKALRQEITVWDAEKVKLQTIDKPGGNAQDLRMIGGGSMVLQLSYNSIQAWNI